MQQEASAFQTEGYKKNMETLRGGKMSVSVFIVWIKMFPTMTQTEPEDHGPTRFF